MITTQNLSKDYVSHRVLDRLNVEIPFGQVTAILGKNGSGKTTLIKLLLNMLEPSQGVVLYDGTPVREIGYKLYHRLAAVLESVDNLYDYLSGKENIRYFLGLSGVQKRYDDKEIQELIRSLHLEAAMDKPVGTYSRGMKQKLSLIIALMTQADILFLDEPTLGLDFESHAQLLSFIKELAQNQGKTIILTSHEATVIEKVADNVLLLDKGRLLFEGTLESFKQACPHHTSYFVLYEGKDFPCKRYTFKSKTEQANFIEEHIKWLPYLKRVGKEEPTIDHVLAYFYKE